jgi:hypothetical protein
MLRRVVARALRIVEGKAVVDRDADFMRVEIAGFKETHRWSPRPANRSSASCTAACK